MQKIRKITINPEESCRVFTCSCLEKIKKIRKNKTMEELESFGRLLIEMLNDNLKIERELERQIKELEKSRKQRKQEGKSNGNKNSK